MMGLGSVDDVSLAEARDKAAAARKLVAMVSIRSRSVATSERPNGPDGACDQLQRRKRSGARLLGQSFLFNLQSWSIDNRLLGLTLQ